MPGNYRCIFKHFNCQPLKHEKKQKIPKKKGEDNDINCVQSDIGLENGKPGDTR
jgi:hypothetical protein